MNQAEGAGQEVLEHLKSHLKGKVILLGIGNCLQCDDAVGSLLASRIQGKVSLAVMDAGPTPENYLGKIIRERPDTVLLVDAVDYGAAAGAFELMEGGELKTVNLYSTHNASLALVINYLQKELPADIIMLLIQPKRVAFGDTLSSEVEDALNRLTEWFLINYEAEG